MSRGGHGGRGDHRVAGDPRVVQDRGVLRGAGALVPRLQRRRHGGLQGPDGEARLLAVAGHRLPVGAAVLHLAPARRRLRRGRLHRHPPGVRHGRGLPHVPGRGPPARDPGDRRLRDEPHQRRAPVVPGQPERPGRPLRRLLRLVRHRRALPGSPHHLRRHRAVQLDLGPGPPAVLLAPVLRPPARPQLRQPEGARGDAGGDGLLARHGPRRLPPRRRALSLRAARHQRREPAGDPRVPAHGPQVGRRQLPRPGAARGGQPVAGRRRRLLRRLRRRAATSATCASTSR